MMQTTPSLKQLYFRLIEVPLGIYLYALGIVAKFGIWLIVDPQREWTLLLAVNIAELFTWTIWLLLRHGRSRALLLWGLPAITTIYSSISLSLLALGIHIYPFQDAAIRDGMAFNSIAATNLWGFVCFFHSPAAIRAFQRKVLGWIDGLSATRIGLTALVLMGLIIALAYDAVFIFSGAATLAVTGGNRQDVLDAMSTGRAWVLTAAFIAWMITYAVVHMSARLRPIIGIGREILGILAILLFLGGYESVGNRRELTTGLIFICIVLLFRGRVKLVAASSIVLLGIGMWVGVVRTFGSSPESRTNTVDYYSSLFSEAVMPNFPLLDAIQQHPQAEFGASYIRAPFELLPSLGIWQKPKSLADAFSLHYSGGAMGYAYTPLAEGYVNFGIAAIFLVPFGIVLMQRAVVGIAISSVTLDYPVVLGLVMFSLALDICRGEFESILFEIALYSVLILLYFKLCNLGGNRGNGQRKC